MKSTRILSGTQSLPLSPSFLGAEMETKAAVPIPAFLQNCPGFRQTVSEPMARAKAPIEEGEMMTSGVKGSSISDKRE